MSANLNDLRVRTAAAHARGDVEGAATSHAQITTALTDAFVSSNYERFDLLRQAADEAASAAMCYLKLGKFALAAETFGQAVELSRLSDPKPTEQRAGLLELWAGVELILEGPRVSDLLQESIELRKQLLPKERVGLIRTMVELATYRGTQNDTASFNQQMAAAFLELERATPAQQRDIAESLPLAAVQQLKAGRTAQGLAIMDATRLLALQLGYRGEHMLPMIFQLTAATHLQLGNREAAIKSQEDSLALLEQRYTGENRGILATRSQLAQLHQYGKNPARSETLLAKNLRALEQTPSAFTPIERAEAYVELGEACAQNCKYREAAQHLEKAIQCLPPQEAEQNIEILKLRTELLLVGGKLDEALELTNRALSIEAQRSTRSLIQKSGIQLQVQKFRLLTATGAYDEARECLEELQSSPEGPFEKLLDRKPTLLLAEAELAAALGDTERQGQLLAEAHALARANPALRDSLGELWFLTERAEWECAHGDRSTAVELFERAKEILVDCGRSSHVGMLRVLQGLSDLYSTFNDTERAAATKRELVTVLAELQFLNDGILFDSDDGFDSWQ